MPCRDPRLGEFDAKAEQQAKNHGEQLVVPGERSGETLQQTIKHDPQGHEANHIHHYVAHVRSIQFYRPPSRSQYRFLKDDHVLRDFQMIVVAGSIHELGSVFLVKGEKQPRRILLQ